MKSNEYVRTLVVNNRLVNVGIDESGQTYFCEYYDEKDHELKTFSCGTYNFNYEETIYDFFNVSSDDVQ